VLISAHTTHKNASLCVLSRGSFRICRGELFA
jgi:hypothetical protein